MKNTIFQIIILCQILAISCTNNRLNNSSTSTNTTDNRTSFDSIFYNKFQMQKPGFTGGDGVYSIQLPDNRTVWIFGDTFIGEVSDSLTREKTDPMYIRNCFVIQDGDKMSTLHQGSPEEFKSMIIPDEIGENGLTERDVWFWPGDGFVQKNTLNIFVSKFHQKTSDMWGFEFLETELVQLELPDFNEIGKLKIPYSKENGVHYGHAVYKSENHLYIYGLGNGKPYVARTTYNNLTSNWEFYNGQTWVSDSKKANPMVDFMGSEQFSIFKQENKFIYLSQCGHLSTEVYSFTSNTPYGPWENKKLLFNTPVDSLNSDLFTYNALAHPQLIENNKILISYNTNSMELKDHFTNANIYKPRFMRVHLDTIVKK